MGNVVITASHIGANKSQWDMLLSGNVCHQTTREGNVDGLVAFDTAKTFCWDGLGVLFLKHHLIAKEDLVAKVEVCLHQKEGA